MAGILWQTIILLSSLLSFSKQIRALEITLIEEFSNISHSSTSPTAAHYQPHPLDPLTETELIATVSLVKRYRWETSFIFNYIALIEPPKAHLLQYFLNDTTPPPGTIPRRSLAIIYDRSRKRTYEVTVNLEQQHIEKWEDIPAGVNYAKTRDEFAEAEGIAKRDVEVIDRCKKLGWTDMSLVQASAWPMFFEGDRPEFKGRRLAQMYFSGQNYPGDNANAHPFNFLTIVDIDEGRVIQIEELPTHVNLDDPKAPNVTVHVPRDTSQYFPNSKDPFPYRKGLKRINISQPNGTSYSINGHEIKWQKFKFRVGFNGREGLTIHNLNYKDGSTVRPLFYRMSVAELFVPYGDPRPPYHRKSALDEGEDGLGFNSLPLEAQVDCVGEVHLFSWVLHNDKGEPVNFPRAVCVSEEDTGILWKHTDYRTGRNVVVRSQRLSVSSVVTYNNYDYVLTWHFYQDGGIEFSARMTGLVITNLSAEKFRGAPYGSMVFPHIYSQYHQHFFTLRLDPEIDGNKNTVAVVDVVPLEAPTGSNENPYGQGFTTNVTVLKTVGNARTDISPEKSRTWHIRNDNKLNPYTKQPVAWKLVPWASPPLMMKEDSPLRSRVGFMDYSTWVTPYSDEEMFPVGFYANGTGLPEWVERDLDRKVENTDVVLWYNFGVSHVPRTEDFPSMPVEAARVFLKPVNFFLKNPALDVPPRTHNN